MRNTLKAMTWGQSFLQCRTKSERCRLFRRWLEEEHPELLLALPLLKPEEIDRIIQTTIARRATEAAARN